ncbi:thermonuclease family protein [Aromatoleum bremense]|uniref:Nuclease n=1 Tax=Aromatoleum bremense TaxID=76115 RepID=A0ABX1P243_9RHOO|nr:thermonuclease family protein [Aromatoleum bremense]NMG17687.1 nuclease [Aromatoleum bremense]
MVLAVFLQAASAETLTGRIVGVSDGDTVTLLDINKQQHKIRLQGIDAPEKRQPFGHVSRQHLAGLVFSRQVVANCGKADRYKREVCTIAVDGVDANLAQVAAGLAWHYKQYQKEQRPENRVSYAAAEDRARSGKTGLWSDRKPQAPWEFRKAKREAAARR